MSDKTAENLKAKIAALEEYAKTLGVPPTVLRTDEEMRAYRKSQEPELPIWAVAVILVVGGLLAMLMAWFA